MTSPNGVDFAGSEGLDLIKQAGGSSNDFYKVVSWTIFLNLYKGRVFDTSLALNEIYTLKD